MMQQMGQKTGFSMVEAVPGQTSLCPMGGPSWCRTSCPDPELQPSQLPKLGCPPGWSLASVTKEFFLAALLISSERQLVSLTDSKHLSYELSYELLELLAGCGGALDRAGVGVRAIGPALRGSGPGRQREAGREGGRRQGKTKFKVDELFTAGNNSGLTYSHSEHPKL